MLLNRVRRLRWRLALAASAWARPHRPLHQHHETAKAVRMLRGHALDMQGAHFLSTHLSSEQRAQALNDMHAPMRKFQTRALEAQAGQAPRQGHVHGHEHDWLNAPKASRPAIDESKAIALYLPRWEDFEMGRIELKGSNTPGFVIAAGAEGDARPGALAGSGVNGDGFGSPLGFELPLLGGGSQGEWGLRKRGGSTWRGSSN